MIQNISPNRLVDITRPLSENTPVWPGDQPFLRETSPSGGFVSSRIRMSCHSGTHMDAPSHLRNLSRSIDAIPFHRLICPALVVECNLETPLTEKALNDLPLEGHALLLKATGGARGEEAVYGTLNPEVAKFAAEAGIALLGTDSPSVDHPDTDTVHRIILGSDIPIVENLMLDEVDPGEYMLICLPLLIKNADGAPVRAFLLAGAPLG